MKNYAISQLARLFGLSRSTLLYYDHIGLLSPAARTGTGYRSYSERDRNRLERICLLREAGLPLAEVAQMLSGDQAPDRELLENRLREVGEGIRSLRNQQRLIAAMLKNLTGADPAPGVNKKMWVEMLRSAGMDEEAMGIWHAGFEQRAPQAHHEFLLSLGIAEDEVQQIREWSRRNGVA
jgi:DNA-binding transcriptional MerR regulator